MNITDYAIEDLEKALDSINSFNLLGKEIGEQFFISSKIIELKNNHEIVYSNECDATKEKLNKLIIKLTGIDNDYNKECESKINVIYNAITNDNLREANQIIKELEQILEKNSISKDSKGNK